MNKYVIRPESVVHLIENTVLKNSDVRLFRRTYVKKLGLVNRPIRFKYSGKNSISARLQIEVKFGADVLKTLEKLSSEIKSNLDKMAKISLKSCELTVKGVYNEKENS